MLALRRHINMMLVAAMASCLLLGGCSEIGAGDTGLSLVSVGRLTVLSSEVEILVTWDDGQASGFEYDLMQAVADELGLELDYVKPDGTADDQWGAGVVLGRYDASASQMSKALLTPDAYYNVEEVRWSVPYYEGTLTCLVRASSDIVSLSDLTGKVVAVNGVPDGEDWQSGLPDDITLWPLPWYDCQAALQAGLADALILLESDTSTRFGFYDNYPNLRPIGVMRTGEQYVLLFKPDNPKLLQAVDDSLQRLMDDGTYATIFARHYGYEPTMPIGTTPLSTKEFAT